MDLFVEPAEYAEDQPYSHLVLGTHVIHRGFNMGAIIGTAASLSVASYGKLRKPGFVFKFSKTLKYASRGGFYGLIFGALALTGRMYNQEAIGWQDRSWRLLHHPTQMETDHWSLAGASIGVVATGVTRSTRPRMLLGGAGVGSAAAVVLMMFTRGLRGEPKLKVMDHSRG